MATGALGERGGTSREEKALMLWVSGPLESP